MKVRQVWEWIDTIAPFDTQEGFDNSGLVMGEMEDEIRGVLFALDLTEGVLQEALEKGANLIITHHPFLFNALKTLRYDTFQSKAIGTLIGNRINLIAAHTNWDQAEGGVSDSLAACLELSEVEKADKYVRVGKLPQFMSCDAFYQFVSDRLHVVPHLYGEKPLISTVAVAGGAGGFAAFSAQADAFVTGEFCHHQLLGGTQRGLVLVNAEHYATEFPGIVALMKRFQQEAAFGFLPVFCHQAPPFSGAVR